MNKKKIGVKNITVTAIMGAVGFVLMLLEFPLTFIIPSFIKFDFSELPALICSFALGPIWGILVCLIKNLLHLFVSNTGGVGEISNFVLGAIFVGVAGLVYQKIKSRKGALIGTLIGAFIMAVVSLFTNYFVVYPIYTAFMPIEAIIGAYKIILPSVNNLFECLLIFNVPFNFVKGIIVAVICFLIYKKLSPILKAKA